MKSKSAIGTAFVISFLFFFMAVFPIPAQQNKAFNWSLALQNVKTGELIPFSAPVQAVTGEQYKLVIQPDTACYCYVIAESTDGEIGVFREGSLKKGETWYSPVLELTAPGGSESLWVVTSRSEQKVMAQKITDFKKTSGALQKRALMNEVYKLRSDASKFKEAPEKPVLMGGASRGSSPDKNQGVEFSGVDTYVKTISIEH